jgi:cytochrome c oxidase assembly protein subunit 15
MGNGVLNSFNSLTALKHSFSFSSLAGRLSTPSSKFTAHLLGNPNGSGKRIVGYWLAGCSAAVFGIIVFGGLTRLTESGLSMVDWKLIHFKAPQSETEWEAYFALYQQYPEYKM